MIVQVPAQQHAAAAHYIHAEIMMQIPAGNGTAHIMHIRLCRKPAACLTTCPQICASGDKRCSSNTIQIRAGDDAVGVQRQPVQARHPHRIRRKHNLLSFIIKPGSRSTSSALQLMEMTLYNYCKR